MDLVESIEDDRVRLGGGGALLRDEVRWIAYGHSDATWPMTDVRTLDQVLLRDDTWLEGRILSANRQRLVLAQVEGANRLVPFGDLAGITFCDSPCMQADLQPPDDAAGPQDRFGDHSGGLPAGDQPGVDGETAAVGPPPWFSRDSGAECGPGGPTTYCNWNLVVPGVCTFTAQGCGLNITIVKPGRETYGAGENPCYGIAGIGACSGLGSGSELFADFCCDELARFKRGQGAANVSGCNPDVDIDCDGVPNEQDDFPFDSGRTRAGGSNPRMENLLGIHVRERRTPAWLDGHCAPRRDRFLSF